MASKTKSQSSIKAEQWKLPVSFQSDGKVITLGDFVKKDSVALSFSSLDEDQRAELTTKRIQMQPKFELGMIGSGVVSKEQAVAEIKAKTPVGRTLMEIETRTIQFLIEQAEKEAEE